MELNQRDKINIKDYTNTGINLKPNRIYEMVEYLYYNYLKYRGEIGKNEKLYIPNNLIQKNLNQKEIFSQIYENNLWGSRESVSGNGSELKNTKIILKVLRSVISKYQIKSLLDVPCGDYNWIRKLDKTNIKYIGIDIVGEIIKDLKLEFENNKNIQFIEGNIIESFLPKCDLIICRDCLVHFSFADIQKTLDNIKLSNCTYLLTTTFPDRKINRDIPTGGWRPLNLEAPPFNLPSPIKIFNERNLDSSGIYLDKSVGLWKIKNMV